MTISRRDLLKAAAAAGGLSIVGQRSVSADPVNLLTRVTRGEVAPRTPIDHTVVVMMENRSVDHYLGWLADERGRAAFDAVADQAFPDPDADDGTTSSRHWGEGSPDSDYAGCGYRDPGHGWDHGRVQLNGRTHALYDPNDPSTWADGFLLDGSGNDRFAVSYYERADLPVLAHLLDEFTTFDRYFCSVLGPTFPNREYQHSAQSGGIKNNDFPPERGYMTGFPWPTIWDLCEAHGITWAYYFSNLPAIALWGPRLAKNTRHISSYYEDAALGQLPQVAFVDPFFVSPEGVANDDHPHADIRLGQEFLSDVVGAFVESPNWQHGALFINYDEWGGFFDHVPPPLAADDPYKSLGLDQLGFRTPALLVSPYARGGRVDHGIYDHTSILRFIEGNYGMGPLTARDAAASDIGAAFDFVNPPRPEVDLSKLRYRAPTEARVACAARGHHAPASGLFQLHERGWIEAHGYRVHDRLEDSFRALPR